jgi:hypothetical protein
VLVAEVEVSIEGRERFDYEWLTPRRVRVLRELETEATEKEAAEHLGVSYESVRSTVEDLKANLGVGAPATIAGSPASYAPGELGCLVRGAGGGGVKRYRRWGKRVPAVGVRGDALGLRCIPTPHLVCGGRYEDDATGIRSYAKRQPADCRDSEQAP